ncbi:hypothetical protein DICPUDRAFT_85513 [Dictyostelium purpureum]|uniref:Uncharacterized protein n=1 Tax=Dictyostelium purpureum TaxID=5786 RepID=F1A5Z2_DICPU|nr:uncharacterized protein DICPUDRAFT_85513 [Dictyostelium purpureum]EGC28387.1 hypothetical protein DICPUDRAFT_85513 [Dictyostelium purpureum]|eukprot:XP_003295086.1 hypothetical protein DICPUDRAFT_85513 [Dictyostelium purpureum]
MILINVFGEYIQNNLYSNMDRPNKKRRTIPDVDPRAIDEANNQKIADDIEKEIDKAKDDVIIKKMKLENLNSRFKRPHNYEENLEISRLENEIKDGKEEIIEKLYLLKQVDNNKVIHAISLRNMEIKVKELEQSLQNAQDSYETEENKLTTEKINCKEITRIYKSQLEEIEKENELLELKLAAIIEENEEIEKEIEEILKKNNKRILKNESIEVMLRQSEEEIVRLENVLSEMVHNRINKMEN